VIAVPADLAPNPSASPAAMIRGIDPTGHATQIIPISGNTDTNAPQLIAFSLTAADEASAVVSLLALASPVDKGNLVLGDPAPLGPEAGRRVSGQVELGLNLPELQIEAVLAIKDGSGHGILLACPLAPAGATPQASVSSSTCDVNGLLAAAASIKPMGK
jgi:hypothetical protein